MSSNFGDKVQSGGAVPQQEHLGSLRVASSLQLASKIKDDLLGRLNWLKGEIQPLETELRSLVKTLENRRDLLRDNRDLYVLIKTYAELFETQLGRVQQIQEDTSKSFKTGDYKKLFSIHSKYIKNKHPEAIQINFLNANLPKELVSSVKAIQAILTNESPGLVEKLKQQLSLSSTTQKFREQVNLLLQSPNQTLEQMDQLGWVWRNTRGSEF